VAKWARKRVSLSGNNFRFRWQYHSAQQRTAGQQHRQLYIYTASCSVLREEH